MPRDAFVAGVEPGGLTDPAQIKILICFILEEINEPVFGDDILEALSSGGWANYFEIADAMSELAELGHVTVLDEWYTLASSGRNISSLLSSDVALTVRERTLGATSELVRRRSNAKSNKVSITEHEGGFTVKCSVCEQSGREMFSVSLEVPSRKAALKVRERFIDSAEDVMRAAIEALVGEEL